ncbi:pirin family protein [Aestuariivirga sp.]|uniref:pirin family protein n=1 Tax=Aestuariivirga sp. TaxID=2650926 RepID=UPI0039E42E31
MKKQVVDVSHAQGQHWVGDGFPVRSLFSYGEGDAVSPFLLLDYAGPFMFGPSMHRRGVGAHPHRGFETVTIVYDGEVSHSDSTGKGGTIGPGDVQWMTAASGIFHEEYHSDGFTKSGGPFRMVQLWVNLPAKHKMSKPGYQAIGSASIPVAELPDGAGSLRVIAGDFGGTRGAARTFSPLNVWDAQMKAGHAATFTVPEGHTAMVVVLGGRVTIDGQAATEAEVLRLSREGDSFTVMADGDAKLLILTGKPLGEPVVGYGPFVMNTDAEIRQAIEDVNAGRFLTPANTVDEPTGAA